MSKTEFCSIQLATADKIAKLLINFKKTSKSRHTRGYLEARKESLEEYWKKYTCQHDKITEKVTPSELKAIGYDLDEQYNHTEEQYLELKSLIIDNLYEVSKTVDVGSSSSSQNINNTFSDAVDHSRLKTKLPPISIPKFTGNYADWMSFRDLFTTLIHKEQLSNIEKHHYLKCSLGGEAEQLLKHFALTDANYEKAWNTLEDRYNNKRMIVNNLLNRFLSQKKLNNEYARGLKELIDTTRECLNSLENLGLEIEKWDAIIVHIVVSKLDTESHKLWEQSLGCSQEIPTFKTLASHLESRFKAMEMVNFNQKKDIIRKDTKFTTNAQRSTTFKTYVTENIENTCTFCSQGHYICHCKEFGKLGITERQDFVKKNGICFNCLVKGHSVSHCRQSTVCRKCGRRHHTMLHFTRQTTHEEATNKIPEKTEITSMATETENEQVILATAQIAVKSRNGVTCMLRALIDQGSQASFITEKAAQLLSLERTSVNGKISGISNTGVVITKAMVTLNFTSIHAENNMISTKAYVLKKVTSLLPSREFSLDDWSSLKTLKLADPQLQRPSQVDILLGADVYAQIIWTGLMKHDSLIAQNSKLGWLISGGLTQTNPQSHNIIVMHTLDVDKLLKRFWEIEEYLPQKKQMTQLEEKCEELYMNTHTRNSDGRYIVKLPMKDLEKINLGDTKGLAISRLNHMERKFTHKPEFKKDYVKFMREYELLGHMEEIPVTEKQRHNVYYLPHHAVIRESSYSTKLRVVFDGSAKPNQGNSLNEESLIGPPLQQDIRNLVTRWRKHKYCLVADIKQMYRQILISHEDTDYQRIVWRESTDDPIKEYRLLTVTYGTASAPYLAIRTLRQLADDEKVDFPNESEIIKNDFYMDDLLSGFSTEEEAVLFQERVTKLLKRGGFDLHKWCSNSESVLNKIPTNDKVSQNSVDIKIDNSIKALGISWNPHTDVFELKMIVFFNNDICTKRNVLSAIAKIFDPLGWLSPVVIVAKIFIQKLWLYGLQWDDVLPGDLESEWKTYTAKISEMPLLTLDRWLGVVDNQCKFEIHGFCDASTVAYAAVIYMRVINKYSQIKVTLVMAKTKVAPVKQVSLPRLELCGAVLLANMINDVKKNLDVNDDSVFAWTDSTIVLSWLKKHPNHWKTFVANRTTEILNSTNSSQWHHVPSAHNPADCASRGIDPDMLHDYKLWWSGPQFLKDTVDIIHDDSDVIETNLESKTKVVNNACVITDDFMFSYLNRFSKLSKLIRVTAYCIRFIKCCQAKLKHNNDETVIFDYLTTKELQYAKNICIKFSQFVYFQKEIDYLKMENNRPKGSCLQSLNPKLDENNILRVGGRIANAQISKDMKYPILLHQNCNLSLLIVRDAHLRCLHGGQQLTLNIIRRTYWILRGKNLVRSVIRKCIPCFKNTAAPTFPLMGNLPKFRVTPSRPFSSSGVDYAGPITLKLFSGRCVRTCKAYICLFICTVTKAIHLELASDLTSSAYLAAFKRFTARRGHCANLYSDCGTNFVGASHELDVMLKNAKSNLVKEISELLANDGTTWHFNPPGAPHFGGLWEAGVKSIKGHLKRVIGQTCLTYEEYSTLLTQVEACVNSRPLTLNNSLDDNAPITPGHFLIGEAPILIPEENLEDVKLNHLQRWQLVQRMVQTLWRRWQSEYLTTLQHRYKWFKSKPNLDIGTIVLVKDTRLPPAKWMLARVIKIHPGEDDITRVVTLQSKNNIFKRPVAKLCPFPIDVLN